MSDKKQTHLEIHDLAVLCYLGVTQEEQAYPQKLLISCTLSGDFEESMRSDLPETTIDYAFVAGVIEDVVESKAYRLIEHVAYALHTKVYALCEDKTVTIQVKKPNALERALYTSFTIKE